MDWWREKIRWIWRKQLWNLLQYSIGSWFSWCIDAGLVGDVIQNYQIKTNWESILWDKNYWWRETKVRGAWNLKGATNRLLKYQKNRKSILWHKNCYKNIPCHSHAKTLNWKFILWDMTCCKNTTCHSHKHGGGVHAPVVYSRETLEEEKIVLVFSCFRQLGKPKTFSCFCQLGNPKTRQTMHFPCKLTTTKKQRWEMLSNYKVILALFCIFQSS